MSYRTINGIGCTISPIPCKDELSIAIEWFVIFFIPIFPYGVWLVKGSDYGKFYKLKKISIDEAKLVLGGKGILLTALYTFVRGILACILLLSLFGFIIYLRS